ncbi:hypothetical protein BpHYR1_018429 [Brachionus plicatilis]|uniref:Uncharacterized protein n=1 Tax=Brachionus plicatilis TaxID=10195 RepID=A0A3M7PJB2_BRAPC|nr:hypothetical protein BpHYR1_018429 [Brachionus plicatilis]
MSILTGRANVNEPECDLAIAMSHKNSNGSANKVFSKSSQAKREPRRITFSYNHSSNFLGTDLKIEPSLQEPTTPIDKLNTPRTVTVPTAFFPPSPTPIVENEITITGFTHIFIN